MTEIIQLILPSNRNELTDNHIKTIRKKYVDPFNIITCDDYHQHKYDCVKFDNETAAVIERLIIELDKHETIIANIKQMIK